MNSPAEDEVSGGFFTFLGPVAVPGMYVSTFQLVMPAQEGLAERLAKGECCETGVPHEVSLVGSLESLGVIESMLLACYTKKALVEYQLRSGAGMAIKLSGVIDNIAMVVDRESVQLIWQTFGYKDEPTSGIDKLH